MMNIFYISFFLFISICPNINATFTANDLYVLPSKYNFLKSLEACKKESLHLLKIIDADTNKIAYDFAVRAGIKNYFIDVNDTKADGVWAHSDGNKADYLNFLEGQDKKDHCANGFNADAKWTYVSCDEESSIICYSGKSAISEKQLHILPATGNFETAQSLCKEKSMNLIKIMDAATNLVVQKFAFRVGIGEFWIDATDKAKEGEWCTVDGTKLPFTNFRENQPDNWQDNEHCAQANRNNPTWNDLSCDSDMFIMCYSETVPA